MVWGPPPDDHALVEFELENPNKCCVCVCVCVCVCACPHVHPPVAGDLNTLGVKAQAGRERELSHAWKEAMRWGEAKLALRAQKGLWPLLKSPASRGLTLGHKHQQTSWDLMSFQRLLFASRHQAQICCG